MKELPNIKSSTIIKCMKGIFSHLGILERVVSDNQTCFRSAEYVQFAKDWDFEDVTSSQHHSQGNGFSEAYVKIYKCIFTKAKSINTDPFISLLEYRNTKLSSTNFSPATLLMSRELRSILPTAKEKLKLYAISPETVCTRLHILTGGQNRLNLLNLEVQHMFRICKTKHGNKQSSLINTMTDHIQYTHQTVQLTDSTDAI